MKKAPVINNEQTKEQLLKLQKKLVFNAATNNSFFTEISDSSNNLMDVSRLLRAFPENGLKDLFEKDNVTFPFSKMKALDKTENSKTKSKESKQKSLRTHLTPKEIDRCKMQ
ncbi:hypothetical protein FACS1894166_08190 [Bacilli bacterium]|nr:hypothetical protein FACS1894166_08190 [Bacilli bacterium]